MGFIVEVVSYNQPSRRQQLAQGKREELARAGKGGWRVTTETVKVAQERIYKPHFLSAKIFAEEIRADALAHGADGIVRVYEASASRGSRGQQLRLKLRGGATR
jgi:hypothetical protein